MPTSSDDYTASRRTSTLLSSRPWVLVAGAAGAALIVGAIGGVVGANLTGNNTSVAVNPTGNTTACDARTVAANVLPTVVTISVQAGNDSGVGSGVVIRRNGYIITNNHVISAAANGGTIDVLFNSGQHVAATLVGRDPRSDLAVLKVAGNANWRAITVGDSEAVDVGEPVVALGAPLGLTSTVTAGIVSALGRNVTAPSDNNTTTTLVGSIQTDAAINPGNSGGALVDCEGALIGINTAIATVPNETGAAGGGSVGIGFAVPTSLAMSIADEIISTGNITYPYVGVSVALITDEAANDFGVSAGLFIQEVTAGGPADKAGLQEGDIITSIDGQPANSTDLIVNVALGRRPGDVVTVDYVRDSQRGTAKITLGATPAS